MSSRLIALILIFSLGLVGVSLYVISTLDPGKKPSPQADIINMDKSNLTVSSDFVLHDMKGERFDKESFKNKYSIIYFGFTHCPDFCDESLTKLSSIISGIDKKYLNDVQFVFISVDPNRDTKDVLQKYVGNFNDKIIAATGELKEIEKLTNSLKAYFSIKQPTESDDNYYVDHSAFFYLTNKEGILVDQFTYNAKPEAIIERCIQHISK